MNYADIEKKWVVYPSDPMHEHAEKTYKNNLEKDLWKARTSLKKISTREFVCEPDAQAAVENIRNLCQNIHWITHVPSTITEVKTLLHADVPLIQGYDIRYLFYETTSDYGDIPQKWVLVHSREMQTRKEKTFEKSLEKMDAQTIKSLKKLCGLEFACDKDAQAAADHWLKNHPSYQYSQITIVPISRKIEVKRGRPRNDEERLIVFSIQAEIERNNEVILAKKEKLGRFILASNDLSLDQETMLDYYKKSECCREGIPVSQGQEFQDLRGVFEKAGENRGT